jgi:hypothetical protein
VLFGEGREGKGLLLELSILEALNRSSRFHHFAKNEIGEPPEHDLKVSLLPVEERNKNLHVLIGRSRNAIDRNRKNSL